MSIYTDRTMMANGEVREWHRSPISRLYIANNQWLLYLQLALAAASVITAVLLLFKIKSATVRRIWIISTIASTAVFIIIMIVTSNTHADYA